jgi:ferredoxin-thioredoxin reductase catalytic subunit
MNDAQKFQKQVDTLYETLKKEAENGGYHLNPDIEFTKELIEGLLTNKKRYGYQSCPCRLAEGAMDDDRDIICPCDYRDPDLNQYGACYCGLYVSQKVIDGKIMPGSIPERRPQKEMRKKIKEREPSKEKSSLAYPVWRCNVCGYLCARNDPPEICPICRAKQERFSKFLE